MGITRPEYTEGNFSVLSSIDSAYVNFGDTGLVTSERYKVIDHEFPSKWFYNGENWVLRAYPEANKYVRVAKEEVQVYDSEYDYRREYVDLLGKGLIDERVKPVKCARNKYKLKKFVGTLYECENRSSYDALLDKYPSENWNYVPCKDGEWYYMLGFKYFKVRKSDFYDENLIVYQRNWYQSGVVTSEWIPDVKGIPMTRIPRNTSALSHLHVTVKKKRYLGKELDIKISTNKYTRSEYSDFFVYKFTEFDDAKTFMMENCKFKSMMWMGDLSSGYHVNEACSRNEILVDTLPFVGDTFFYKFPLKLHHFDMAPGEVDVVGNFTSSYDSAAVFDVFDIVDEFVS
jgi:hypothetical protein